jgi:L,D-transpeptidase catalytic domain
VRWLLWFVRVNSSLISGLLFWQGDSEASCRGFRLNKALHASSLRAGGIRRLLVGRRFAAGGLLTAFALGGCASTQPPPPPAALPVLTEPPPLYEWNPGVLVGEPNIIIDLRTQRADVYIGGLHAGWSLVATGKEGFDTPAGDYIILEKLVDKYSTLYGKIVDADGRTIRGDADIRRHSPPAGGRFVFAPMPYWMRLTWRGIGMHAGPIPRPGRTASHGCIRLPREFAVELFQLVRVGTPVRIIR